MNNKWLKNIFTVLLILFIAGAVFFCLTIGTMSISHTSHGSATNQESTASHILHSKELTLAIVVFGSLIALASLFLTLAFTSFLSSFYKLEFFVQNKLLSYLRFRKRHLFNKIDTLTHSYLSLFVRSPEYIKLT